MPVDPALQHLVRGFLDEATDASAQMTRRLLEIERAQTDSELVAPYNELARHMHTLKGSAATLGLDDLASLAHTMESALAPGRTHGRPLSGADVDNLLRGLDVFLGRLRSYAAADPVDETVDEGLLARLGVMAGAAQPSVEREVTAAAPLPEVLHDDGLDGSWRVSMTTVAPLMHELDRLREGRLRFADRSRQVGQALDRLALERAHEAQEAAAILTELVTATNTDGEELGDIADALEETVKTILTQPVHTILDPLRRMVRDLARASGKEAALSVVGGELSIDRRVLGALRGALVHLLRNAIDHGIETPDVREARGKHRAGAVVLRVEHQGNLVLVEVADDGEGLPTRRVADAALELGLVDAAALARMDAKQIDQLVFLPGLSTRKSVSETSGRGVGLDAVKTQIEALDGNVEVESVAAQGTRFVIALPTDLGSSPLLVVVAGGLELALPLLIVESIVKAERVHVGRGMFLEHGGELLAVVDLAARLGLSEAHPPAPGQQLLVVNVAGKRMAVSVDEIVGHWELAVRALPPEIRELPGYRGACIISGGRPILVLRPEWIVEATFQKVERPAKLALVVDDALTARALHRGMLEAGGYVVHTATDAQQALERLRATSYDLVVCDIAMEGTDGITLTSLIRSNPATRLVPVVLVTAHESDAVRERARAVGADAFLTKRECRAGRLLVTAAEAVARRGAAPVA